MALTGYGISAVEIATLLEVDRKTLAKHYRRELDIGATEANARVAQALYTNATRHNSVAAQIWWTKARMKWKDASDLTIAGDLGVTIGIDRPPEINESREEWVARRKAELVQLDVPAVTDER